MLLPPPTVTLLVFLHSKKQCWILIHVLCHSFQKRLFLFLPFLACLSISTLSLLQIKLSCIPDIPAAYVRYSSGLLWPCSLSSTLFFMSSSLTFTRLLPIYSHTSGLRRTKQLRRTWLNCQVDSHLPFAHSSFSPSSPEPEPDRAMWRPVWRALRQAVIDGATVQRDTQKTDLICGSGCTISATEEDKKEGHPERAGCARQKQTGMMLSKQDGVNELHTQWAQIVDIVIIEEANGREKSGSNGVRQAPLAPSGLGSSYCVRTHVSWWDKVPGLSAWLI